MTDLPRLVRACRGVIAERDLVTPCCRLTPELRAYLLWCPCGKAYGKLAELVAVERKTPPATP